MAVKNLLQTALKYAAKGWFVIPLKPGSKAPNSELLPARDPSKPKSKKNPGSPNQFAETAATPEQIRSWWGRVPNANIGLICNYASGVMVVDLDPNKREGDGYKLGEARRRELLERDGFEETPLVVKTTSGGWHLYYKHPRSPLRVVSKTKHEKSPGVDVQAGKMCYVVAPPSIYSGKRYAWQGGFTDELPAAPAWTIVTTETEGYRVHSGDNNHWRSTALMTTIKEGGTDGGPGRNQTLRSLAQAKAQRGDPFDIGFAEMMNWNLAQCDPPLTETEVYSNTFYMYQMVAKDLERDLSDRVRLRYNGPAFPFESLQKHAPRIYYWALAVHDTLQAHPDMIACAGLLGLASAASYCRIEIEGVGEWKPPAHLWGTIVYESGGRKSAVYKMVMRALEPTRKSLAAIAEVFNNAVETEREILEGRKRSIRAQLIKSDTPENLEALRDVNLEIKRIPENIPSSWTTSDATAEAFLIMLGALGWGGLFSEEGADVLKGFFGHYSGKTDLSGLLKGYDLGSTEQNRVGRGYLKIEETRVNLFIMTQPSVLAGLDRTEAEDRGFLARMQFCIPNDDFRTALPPCVGEPEKALKDFDAMMLGVYYGGDIDKHNAAFHYKPEYAGCSFDEDDELGAPAQAGLQRPVCRDEYTVHVSAEVWAILSTFQSEMTEMARSGGAHRTAKSWCKKAGEHALRLAVVIELAESNGKARELTRERAELGIELVREYFLYQYYVAVDRMGCPRIADQGIHVLQRFRDHESFTTADLVNDLHCTTEEAAELVRWLADRQTLSYKGRGRNLECKVLPGVDY